MSVIPGTASLIEDLDVNVLIVLRDGRKLFGFLRTFDQFANIILEDTRERIYVGNYYADKELGLYMLRGDFVVIIGVVDEEKEALSHKNLKKVSPEEILAMQKEEAHKNDKVSRHNFDMIEDLLS